MGGGGGNNIHCFGRNGPKHREVQLSEGKNPSKARLMHQGGLY